MAKSAGVLLVPSVPKHLHIKGSDTNMILHYHDIIDRQGEANLLVKQVRFWEGVVLKRLLRAQCLLFLLSLLLYHCEVLSSSTHSTLFYATLPYRPTHQNQPVMD